MSLPIHESSLHIAMSGALESAFYSWYNINRPCSAYFQVLKTQKVKPALLKLSGYFARLNSIRRVVTYLYLPWRSYITMSGKINIIKNSVKQIRTDHKQTFLRLQNSHIISDQRV